MVSDSRMLAPDSFPVGSTPLLTSISAIQNRTFVSQPAYSVRALNVNQHAIWEKQIDSLMSALAESGIRASVSKREIYFIIYLIKKLSNESIVASSCK
mgnify:CR=1 FL=1